VVVRRITIEEHFRSKKVPNPPGTSARRNPQETLVVDRPQFSFHITGDELTARTFDITDLRLKEMDAAGIDMQVLSHTTGLEPFDATTGVELSKQVDDEIYQTIKKYPTRFAAFATLAPQDPNAAAIELERAVKQLGFVGGKINSNIKGEYLDDQRYWSMFAMAEKLDVPIYLHPLTPAGGLLKLIEDYPPLVGGMLGFGMDASIASMRLICSGLFDEHPRLKIILGHLGEAIPFWFWRIDKAWERRVQSSDPKVRKLSRKPGQVILENFYTTTSGFFDTIPFMCNYAVLGGDHILFAVDYPYQSNIEAVHFIENVPICATDREKVCHLNAERILKLH
jgi:predicted TIM-barrel fold metal-dependent hydrolase